MEESREIERNEFGKPVFIVGVPRSGTSMLWNILVRLAEFSGKSEPFWNTETSIFKKYVANMNFLFTPNVWPFWFEYYDGRREYFDKFLVESCRSFLVNASKSRGAQRILEKTPNHIECLDFIVKVFSDARIIHICRHPVDVYASMKRRALITPINKDPWLRVSACEFGESYNEKINKALNFRQNIFHLRYEDVTENPENKLREVCDFIEVVYLKSCIIGQVPIKKVDIFPIKSNSPVKNSNNWHDILTVGQVDELQLVCLETINKLEYPIY